MPNIRGLLHSKPKIDEEELGLAQSRAAARLADLSAQHPAPSAEDEPTPTGDFLDMVEDWAGDGVHTAASEPLETRARPTNQ